MSIVMPFGTTMNVTICEISSMPSRKRPEPLDDFETDVPITAEDSEAQWRLRIGRRMSSREYLEWCSWLTRDHVEPCRDFHEEPFEL